MYIILVAKFRIVCFNKMSQILQNDYKQIYRRVFGYNIEEYVKEATLVPMTYPIGYGWRT